jgi:hypothetical protein
MSVAKSFSSTSRRMRRLSVSLKCSGTYTAFFP